MTISQIAKAHVGYSVYMARRAIELDRAQTCAGASGAGSSAPSGPSPASEPSRPNTTTRGGLRRPPIEYRHANASGRQENRAS